MAYVELFSQHLGSLHRSTPADVDTTRINFAPNRIPLLPIANCILLFSLVLNSHRSKSSSIRESSIFYVMFFDTPASSSTNLTWESVQATLFDPIPQVLFIGSSVHHSKTAREIVKASLYVPITILRLTRVLYHLNVTLTLWLQGLPFWRNYAE